MFDIKPFLEEGKKKEGEFAETLCNTLGGNAKPADKQTDINKHIDVFWYFAEGKKPAGIDVKGIKKDKRSDSKPNPNIQWVELQNVNGKKGWLFGEADYVAFEGEEDWIMIRRKKLAKIIDEAIVNKSITHDVNESWYRYYQRKGRQDILTKVNTNLIRRNADKIIIKQKPDN